MVRDETVTNGTYFFSDNDFQWERDRGVSVRMDFAHSFFALIKEEGVQFGGDMNVSKEICRMYGTFKFKKHKPVYHETFW